MRLRKSVTLVARSTSKVRFSPELIRTSTLRVTSGTSISRTFCNFSAQLMQGLRKRILSPVKTLTWGQAVIKTCTLSHLKTQNEPTPPISSVAAAKIWPNKMTIPPPATMRLKAPSKWKTGSRISVRSGQPRKSLHRSTLLRRIPALDSMTKEALSKRSFKSRRTIRDNKLKFGDRVHRAFSALSLRGLFRVKTLKLRTLDSMRLNLALVDHVCRVEPLQTFCYLRLTSLLLHSPLPYPGSQRAANLQSRAILGQVNTL